MEKDCDWHVEKQWRREYFVLCVPQFLPDTYNKKITIVLQHTLQLLLLAAFRCSLCRRFSLKEIFALFISNIAASKFIKAVSRLPVDQTSFYRYRISSQLTGMHTRLGQAGMHTRLGQAGMYTRLGQAGFQRQAQQSILGNSTVPFRSTMLQEQDTFQ